jgi:hypothetical protein
MRTKILLSIGITEIMVKLQYDIPQKEPPGWHEISMIIFGTIKVRRCMLWIRNFFCIPASIYSRPFDLNCVWLLIRIEIWPKSPASSPFVLQICPEHQNIHIPTPCLITKTHARRRRARHNGTKSTYPIKIHSCVLNLYDVERPRRERS